MTCLDVRPVPPKDRYETIMGAYEALEAGEAMELSLDHDPSCMYYALKGTRGDEAFHFEYLERGPETWRVRVRKVQDVPPRDWREPGERRNNGEPATLDSP